MKKDKEEELKQKIKELQKKLKQEKQRSGELRKSRDLHKEKRKAVVVELTNEKKKRKQ